MRRPRPVRPGSRTQTWSAFVRNHAREVLACNFFLTVTARFRLVYVFIVLDVGTRQLVHWNVTDHPTAAWVVPQFRTCVTGESTHRFIVHDRDSIYSEGVDLALATLGLRVLKTPVAVPQANAYCERVIGTARRECLDYVIPLNQRHLRRVLSEWVTSLQSRSPTLQATALGFLTRYRSSAHTPGHQISRTHRLTAKPILGGLHHEYGLEAVAA
jgi:putative transposase